MSFTLLLNSVNGTQGLNGNNKNSLYYNIAWEPIIKHQYYEVTCNLITEGISADATDIGYLTCNFSGAPHNYYCDSQNALKTSFIIQTFNPLSYGGTHNLSTNYNSVPVIIEKPNNPQFLVEFRKLDGTYYTDINNDVNYFLMINFKPIEREIFF